MDNKLKHEYIEMMLISVPNWHGDDFIHQFITWQIPACSTSSSDFALLEHKSMHSDRLLWDKLLQTFTPKLFCSPCSAMD